MTDNTHDPLTLEGQIHRILDEMNQVHPSSEAYAQMTTQLEKLLETKTKVKKGNRPSADTLLVVAGNLTGILSILIFERGGIVTSKALGFVMKSKP